MKKNMCETSLHILSQYYFELLRSKFLICITKSESSEKYFVLQGQIFTEIFGGDRDFAELKLQIKVIFIQNIYKYEKYIKKFWNSYSGL